MKKVLSALILAMFALTMVFANGTQEADDGTVKVGISKILAHPALDASEQGIQDYLNANSEYAFYYDLQNANGEASTSSSIAQKFKSDKVDFAIGIGTPVAQALANVFSDTPVIYVAITDPVSAGLTGSNVCGTSDLTPVESQVKLFAQILGAKSLGNIYTSSEANGIVLNKMFVEACEKYGVKPVSVAVANTAEVRQAAQTIIDRIDGMYIATDNAVVSALPSIAEVCTKGSVALMTADASNCESLDFTIAMGFNYYKLGQAAGKIIEAILKGAKPADYGVVYLTEAADFETWINLDNAARLGITIPKDIIASATAVIKDGRKL
ncbi:MAG: ABC transporter substrate-binding protein [Sphaerochaetaceae bacterium]|jgi:putative ABC transport system substrate-binding protein|nr:ABC transporter substrate-binding protein [Sphaerochaetaceae bacterium]